MELSEFRKLKVKEGDVIEVIAPPAGLSSGRAPHYNVGVFWGLGGDKKDYSFRVSPARSVGRDIEPVVTQGSYYMLNEVVSLHKVMSRKDLTQLLRENL